MRKEDKIEVLLFALLLAGFFGFVYRGFNPRPIDICDLAPFPLSSGEWFKGFLSEWSYVEDGTGWVWWPGPFSLFEGSLTFLFNDSGLAQKAFWYSVLPISCISMYIFLRKVTSSMYARFLASFIYGVNPFTINEFLLGGVLIIPFMFLPLILLFLSNILEEKAGTARNVFQLAFWLGLSTFFNPQTLLFFSPFVIISTFVWSTERRNTKYALKILLCLLAALSISLVNVLPTHYFPALTYLFGFEVHRPLYAQRLGIGLTFEDVAAGLAASFCRPSSLVNLRTSLVVIAFLSLFTLLIRNKRRRKYFVSFLSTGILCITFWGLSSMKITFPVFFLFPALEVFGSPQKLWPILVPVFPLVLGLLIDEAWERNIRPKQARDVLDEVKDKLAECRKALKAGLYEEAEQQASAMKILAEELRERAEEKVEVRGVVKRLKRTIKRGIKGVREAFKHLSILVYLLLAFLVLIPNFTYSINLGEDYPWEIFTAQESFSKYELPSVYRQVYDWLEAHTNYKEEFFRILWLSEDVRIDHVGIFYPLTPPFYSSSNLSRFILTPFLEDRTRNFGRILASVNVKYVIVNLLAGGWSGMKPKIVEDWGYFYAVGDSKEFVKLLEKQNDLEMVENSTDFLIYENLDFTPHISVHDNVFLVSPLNVSIKYVNNLVPDGDFENGHSYWTEAGVWTLDNDTFYSGNRSLKCGAMDRSGSAHLTIPVSGNITAYISVWMKIENVRNASFRVYLHDKEGYNVGGTNLQPEINGTRDWWRVSTMLKPPLNTTVAKIYLSGGVSLDEKNPAMTWFDDIKFFAGPELVGAVTAFHKIPGETAFSYLSNVLPKKDLIIFKDLGHSDTTKDRYVDIFIGELEMLSGLVEVDMEFVAPRDGYYRVIFSIAPDQEVSAQVDNFIVNVSPFPQRELGWYWSDPLYLKSGVHRILIHSKEVKTTKTLWEEIIRDDTVGYWSMDEGIGRNVSDSSGNNNHGTLFNDPEWTDGYHGSALKFDDADDYVNVLYDESLETVEKTIEAYIYPDDLTIDHQVIIERGGGDSVLELRDYNLIWYVRDEEGTNYAISYYLPSTYRWYHVAGVARSDGWIGLYVDGSLKAEATMDAAPEKAPICNLTIGSSLDRSFHGLIDEVRRSESALHPNDFLANTYQGFPTTHKILIFSSKEESLIGNEIFNGNRSSKLDSVRISQTEYRVRIRSENTTTLVFGQSYHEGWKAFVDGTELEHFPIGPYDWTNGFYLNEDGEHFIEIRFVEQSLRTKLLLLWASTWLFQISAILYTSKPIRSILKRALKLTKKPQKTNR